MSTINTWNDFVSSVGPFIPNPRPLDALKQAGFTLGGEVAKAFAQQPPPVHSFGPGAFQALEAVVGQAPKISLHVGRSLDVQPKSLGGFRAVGSADMTILNDVLAELWRVRTIPQQLTDEQTGQVLTLADLKDACTGVPSDAVLGQLGITAPPVASASTVTPLNLHLTAPFNLPVQAASPASLRGVVHVELPLGFENKAQLNETERHVRLTLDAIGALKAQLEVSSASVLQFRSDAKRKALEQKLEPVLRKVLTFLYYEKSALAFPGDVTVSSSFPNSKVDITDIGAVSIRKANKDFLVVGINIVSSQGTQPAALVPAELPTAANNLHAVADESFASDALSAIIKSGDLAAFINRVVARHIPVTDPIDVVVNGGSMSFDDNLLRVSVDCVLANFCALSKDLGFTAKVFGIPTIADGTLTITGSKVDMDVDTTDAIICGILGNLLGPLALLITDSTLAFIAAYNPDGRNFEFPTEDTSQPLPGSEQDFKIELTHVSASPGRLAADGKASLVPDTLRAFVYLRLVTSPMPQLKIPVAGATVELLELDSPAPAGDDVVIPQVGETDTITPKFIISDSRTYQPMQDQSLGTRVTDETGFVRFVAPLRSVGGIFTEVKTKEDVQTGKVISTETHTQLVPEAKPDFAISVTDAGGHVMAKRLLIAKNNPGKHLGTMDQPLVVVIGTPVVVV